MSGKTKQLAQAAVTLVAALLAGKAIQKAAQDRKIRSKASDLSQAARKQVRTAGKAVGENLNRLAQAARKQAPEIGREAVKQVKRLSKTASG
jgi:hypothetical protein